GSPQARVKVRHLRRGFGRDSGGNRSGYLQPVPNVLREDLTHVRSVWFVEQIRAQVGRADGIGFLHNQVLSLDEPRCCGRKTEPQKQTEQTENSALDSADLAGGR